MANRIMTVKTNANQLLAKLTNKFKKLRMYGKEVVDAVAEEFVKQARQRLIDSGYKVENLVNNIVVISTSNPEDNSYSCKIGWREGISQDERKIMYFLEFGTGIVGLNNPHELSSKVGWEYIINPENLASNSYGYNRYLLPTGTNSIGEDVGLEGWYYYDERHQLQFTSGLKAVSYLYDTMRPENLKLIIDKATKDILNL